MKIRRCQELKVYQMAFDIACVIFDFSKKWPKEERYALTDQIRRSSRSVCANIAEAWSKRRYPKHFISKLTDAEAEMSETKVWLEFALRCGYMPASDAKRLIQNCDKISGGLVKMMQAPDNWCGPSRLLKEPSFQYSFNNEEDHPVPLSPFFPRLADLCY